MIGPDDTTDAPTNDEGALDPQGAANLLTQTKESASRQLEGKTLLASFLGGFVFLVGFGTIWLSVRHQHPYQGPSLGAIGILYLLVLVVDVVAITVYRRSTKGLGGRFTQQRKVTMAIGITALTSVYVIMGALDHAGVNHGVVYGIYPATVPLVVGGVLGAFGAAAREDWTLFAGGLVISAVASGAAFAGPAGAWAVSGIGASAVLFICAGVKFCQSRT